MLVKIKKFDLKGNGEEDVLTLDILDEYEKVLMFKKQDVLKLYFEKSQSEIDETTGELINRTVRFDCGIMNYSVKLGFDGIESAVLKVRLEDKDVIEQIVKEGFISLLLHLSYA